MSSSAKVYIKNTSTYDAIVQLYHWNETTGLTSAGFYIKAGQTSTTYLTVWFEVGPTHFADRDLWHVRFLRLNSSGASAVIYENNGYSHSLTSLWPWGEPPMWKECQLQKEDRNQSMIFEVNTTTFSLRMTSGSCSATMANKGTQNRITNVVVLMLENRSFDNVFANSGISGITVATSNNTNTYNGVTYAAGPGAPDSLVKDPGHEFLDVLEQLAGAGAKLNNGAYPDKDIHMSGFASNYATSTTEGYGPITSNIGEIMLGFETKDELPAIYSLATNFAICDHWYSSMPGPTWPNRFFLHGATSAEWKAVSTIKAWDDSPSRERMAEWESVDGFSYPTGNIFQSLNGKGVSHRLYHDDMFGTYSDLSKHFPQVASLHGIHSWNVQKLSKMWSEITYPHAPNYIFIEPNYGKSRDDSFKGGSSQHPVDGMQEGEKLINEVYSTLRASPIWYTTLFVVIYDEHGGLYDSVKPPTTSAPDTYLGRSHDFNFKQLGVRVPAVVASPWIPRGTVSTSKYEHSSVAKTLKSLFGMSSYLTGRDKNAASLTGLMTAKEPRSDCPWSLLQSLSGGASQVDMSPEELAALHAPPSPISESEAVRPEVQAERDATPLPESGNIWGQLMIAFKHEAYLTAHADEDRAALLREYQGLKTWGEAWDRIEKVHTLIAQSDLTSRYP